MPPRERSVLHVLPHPGGGGETYVDLLDVMPGYHFDRVYLASSSRPALAELAVGLAMAMRRGRQHDLVHVQGEVAAGLCMPLLAARPSVVTLNGLHLVRRLKGFRRSAAVLNLHAVIRTTGRMICVARAERDYLAAAIGQRSAESAVIVRNGVRQPPAPGANRATVRSELGLGGTEPIGIWVGSLDERKGPLTAVRAAEHAHTTMLVIGDGPLRSEVETAAHDHVRVLGHRSDVQRLFGACDFFVQTSDREGLAFSLLEAMAHGLASVVTDIPENVEAVGDAGFVVPIGGDDMLESVISRLAADDRERAVLGERARRRAAEHFNANEMVGRTRAIYDDLLVDRQPRTRPLPTAQ